MKIISYIWGTRDVSQAGIDLIKKFEGFSQTPYADPTGNLTIGYGHLIRPGETYYKLSPEEGEELLREDVHDAVMAVKRLITAPLKQNQLDALVSFTFNVGSGALQRSQLRKHLNNKRYDLAAEEFLKWVYSRGQRLTGLYNRRKAERELFMKG